MGSVFPTADEVIELLDLRPLEGEGGYFRQTYIEPASAASGDVAPRTTAIVFLITAGSWSGLHRLETDELFHFYLGDPCQMVVCSPNGTIEERRLGTDLLGGCTIQALVPGGCWQGTMLSPGGEHGFALLGTTMTPGFRRDQFTLATEADLAEMGCDAVDRLRPYLAANQDAI